MSDKTKTEEFNEYYNGILLEEMNHWAIMIQLKYVNDARKFLFGDEESARKVYDELLEQYKRCKDYKLNVDNRIFTFTAKGNSSSTFDLEEVIAFNISPPVNEIISNA